MDSNNYIVDPVVLLCQSLWEWLWRFVSDIVHMRTSWWGEGLCAWLASVVLCEVVCQLEQVLHQYCCKWISTPMVSCILSDRLFFFFFSGWQVYLYTHSEIMNMTRLPLTRPSKSGFMSDACSTVDRCLAVPWDLLCAVVRHRKSLFVSVSELLRLLFSF